MRAVSLESQVVTHPSEDDRPFADRTKFTIQAIPPEVMADIQDRNVVVVVDENGNQKHQTKSGRLSWDILCAGVVSVDQLEGDPGPDGKPTILEVPKEVHPEIGEERVARAALGMLSPLVRLWLTNLIQGASRLKEKEVGES